MQTRRPLLGKGEVNTSPWPLHQLWEAVPSTWSVPKLCNEGQWEARETSLSKTSTWQRPVKTLQTEKT